MAYPGLYPDWLGAVVLFSLASAGRRAAGQGVQPLYLAVAGVVSAAALVLPGISVSYLLLMFNLYDSTMAAISGLHIGFLLPLLIGLCIGIVLTTKLLDRLMHRHPRATYLIILGFMLASVLEVFPVYRRPVSGWSAWLRCCRLFCDLLISRE